MRVGAHLAQFPPVKSDVFLPLNTKNVSHTRVAQSLQSYTLFLLRVQTHHRTVKLVKVRFDEGLDK